MSTPRCGFRLWLTETGSRTGASLSTMNILAIIPARGGSKGILRKNIRLLAGLPLIAYSINAANESRFVNRVVVSTEDPEIAEAAERLGGEVPFMRPPEFAQDESRDLEVFQHCLGWLQQHEGYVPDVVVHLRPTAPLRTSLDIDRAVEAFFKPPAVDCVRSVTLALQHPLKAWRITEGVLTPFISVETSGFQEPYNMPRQKLGEVYIQNGSVDVIRPAVMTEQNSMTGASIRPMIMAEEDSVNIDSPLDWDLAELLIERKNRAGDGR